MGQALDILKAAGFNPKVEDDNFMGDAIVFGTGVTNYMILPNMSAARAERQGKAVRFKLVELEYRGKSLGTSQDIAKLAAKAVKIAQ